MNIHFSACCHWDLNSIFALLASCSAWATEMRNAQSGTTVKYKNLVILFCRAMHKHGHFHQTSGYFIKHYISAWPPGQMSLLWAVGIHNKTNYKVGIHAEHRWDAPRLQHITASYTTVSTSVSFTLTQLITRSVDVQPSDLSSVMNLVGLFLVQSCWWLETRSCLILTCHWDDILTSHLERCSDETSEITSNTSP